MATLPLQSRMSLSTSYSSTARHRLVEFGDGYIQRTPLGLNSNALLATDGKFYVESFDVQMSDDSRRTITANMIEVFDL